MGEVQMGVVVPNVPAAVLAQCHDRLYLWQTCTTGEQVDAFCLLPDQCHAEQQFHLHPAL